MVLYSTTVQYLVSGNKGLSFNNGTGVRTDYRKNNGTVRTGCDSELATDSPYLTTVVPFMDFNEICGQIFVATRNCTHAYAYWYSFDDG